MARYRDMSIWDVDVPAPFVAIMVGASFYLGYRFHAYVTEKYVEWKNFKKKVGGHAKAIGITAALIPLAFGVFFVASKARR
mmetsp:Transcript_15728/g.38281  ORF Transcript_15728/g.38281 Transcript_15728/m.38281 type:complete len:81 (+) Transcript_15728:137-379(+)